MNGSFLTRVNGLFFDANDTLYMADESTNHVVWRLLKNTVTPTIVAGTLQSAGSSSTKLSSPYDVYVDRKGNMYVSEFSNHRVQKYFNGSTNGITIAGTGLSGSNISQFSSARYMTFDATETYMYVADTLNHRVMRYLTNATSGANGVVVAGGNGAGNTNTSLNEPWGLYFVPSSNGDLLVANLFGHSVMRWNANAGFGTFIAGTPGTFGSSSNLLYYPSGVITDGYMNLYVADSGNHRIQMFCFNNRTGRTLVGTGVAGNSSTQLDRPRDLAFDSAMNMYVSDYTNNRIQKFVRL